MGGTMKKGEHIGFIVAIILIGILFLISTTDLVFRENHNKIYDITVILKEPEGDRYQNCKMGLEKAAKKWNVDITYEHVAYEDGAKNQEKIFKEAQKKGTQAILIDPFDEKQFMEFLSANRIEIPVITLGTTIKHEKITMGIGAEGKKIGNMLAEEILKDIDKPSETVSVYAYADVPQDSMAQNIYKEMTSILESEGIESRLCSRKEFSKWNAEEKGKGVTVALGTQELLFLLNSTKIPEHLYGVGYSNQILANLADEKLEAVVWYNDYDMGYLGMQAAIDRIENRAVEKKKILESSVVYPKDVYRTEYEKRLFPTG